MTAVPDLTAVSAKPWTPTGVCGVLLNPAPLRRREWCSIAVPYGSLEHKELVFVTKQGLHLRALRSETVGSHSVIYRVFAPFDANQQIEGEFYVPAQLEDVIDNVTQPYVTHPWVGDNPVKLIPFVRVRMQDGRTFTSSVLDRCEIVLHDACTLRFAFRARVGGGFVLDGFVTFYSNSPVADFRAALVWSDRTNPASDLTVDYVSFTSGEPVKFDFATQHDHAVLPTQTSEGWTTVVARDIGFVDGSAIPLIGRMTCLPETWTPTAPDDETAQDIETIMAAARYPVLGIAARGTWDGRFLANKNIARLFGAVTAAKTQANAILRPFFENPAASSWYANRPIGCMKDPSGTGDQEDFNATKGWCVTAAEDARWLHYAMQSVIADFFRGPLLYEADGTPLDPNNHPNWVTWSMYTHWHHGQSPDRLGKADTPWGGRSSTTWKNYDEEHRSQNNLAALYALTGDPLLQLLITHYSVSDICNVRYRRNFGTGAPRAIGRQAHCWANFLTLFPTNSVVYQRYKTILDDLLRQTLRDWLGDRFPGPVDILYDRTDPRMGITHNGTVMPAWSCWEHGLFVVGAYAAWKATGDANWLMLVKRVSRTIVRYATMYEPQTGWAFLSTCHWPKTGNSPTGVAEGEPMPSQYYSRSSTLVNLADGGVSTWTRNAVLVFIETHPASDPDMERAVSIANAMTPQESPSPRTAEWFACVRAVPPVPGAYTNY